MLQDDGDGSGFKPPAEGSRLSVLVNDKWMPATVGAAADGSDNYVLLRYDTINSTQRVEFVASSVMVEKAKAPTIRPFVQLPPDAKTKGRPGKQMLLLREGAQAAAEQYKRRQQQSKRHRAQQQEGGAASTRKKQRTATGGAAQPAAAEQFVDEHTPAANGALSPGNQQPQQAPQQAQAAAAAAAGSGLAEEAAPGVAAAAVAGADGGAAAGAALTPPEVAAATPKRHSVTELGSNTFTALAMVAVDDDEEEEQEEEEDEQAAESPRAAALRHDKRRPSTTAQPHTTPAKQLNSCRPTPQLQQRQAGPGQEEEHGHTVGRRAQSAAGDDAAEDGSPVPEPVPERPGDADCRLFAHLLPGLTLQKGSINAAAAAAVQAGQAGACKEVVRCVLEHMRQEPAADKRVVFFYLLDAVLAFSRKEVEGCGPQSIVGAVFPRTVGAALTQLVDLLSPSLAAAQKMEKTLMKTWLTNSRRGVEASLVQRALEALRDRMAQNDAAWANSPLATTPAAAAAAAAAAPSGGAAEQQRSAGPAGRSAQSAAVRGRGRGLDAAQLWRMACKLPMHAAPILTFVNLKDGSKLSVTHKWQPDAWPEYSRLPPAAAAEQYAYKLTVGTAAAAAEQAIRGVPETASPWHDTLASWTGGGPEGWLMQHQHQQLRRHRQLQHQQQQEHLAAAQAAAMAERQLAHRLQQQQQQRDREQQQARGQSTAAGAEPDEFDASLFMGAAGGVAATSSVPDHHRQQQQQRMQAPDMLQALGALQPWGPEAQRVAPPPLPDSSPPLPEDGWEAEEDEDDAFGPPPLPPHSPPRDSYALDGEAGTPPPLPPPEGGSGGVRDRAPFFVPQGDSPPSMQLDPPQQQQQQQQQQVTPAGAVHPQVLPGWGGVPPGFGTPLEYGSGSGQQTPGAAAYHVQQPGWPGPGLPHPQAGHPMLPPGIGVGLTLTPAAMAQAQTHHQQQLHHAQQHAAHQQQMWAAQQQAQAQAQAQQAFFMQAAAAQQQQQQQHMMQHQQLRPLPLLSPPAPGSGCGSIRPHLAQHMPAAAPRLLPTRPPTLRPPI